MLAAVPSVTTSRIMVRSWESVPDGNGAADTVGMPGRRTGCLNWPESTVAATDAIASGLAVSSPSPMASWASSEPEAVAGALKYVADTPGMPMFHGRLRP